MKKFKNNELVIITKGKYKGITGKVVDNEGPITLVMLSTTKEVINAHENHMRKINLAIRKKDYKEYEALIKALDVDIEIIYLKD